nr:hypothetical protein [Tanacetum cinerariifolium]
MVENVDHRYAGQRECKLLRIEKRATLIISESRWNSKLEIGLCSSSHLGKGLYDSGPEFTWEHEDSFKKKYPHLFTNRTSSSTTRS